ncbi:acyltransferase [Ructibacterium gallinarum]|uniref:Acyltransferase n=1 Tax=Ructibacterium gallinarum TaxID=2779355 RepID=A0A9D5R7X5_9FIRM|nr:acyltransferase [Ructibacterium gallinarum]MBE5039340.1 acyltransferase [Ructibacterium gallinarum]
MKIMRLIRKIYGRILARFDRVGYLRWIGLNFGEDIHIYGNPSKMFGTEPWCITLGNHVHITDEVKFVTHDGGTLLFRHLVPDLEITKPIVVGDYVYFGTRSMIMPGVKIGNQCIIAAGAVVTRDVPDHSVVGGVPAHIIKTSEEYFEKIKKESLHLGHLEYEQKDKALKKFYGVK